MLNDLLFRLRALFRQRAVDAELEDELRLHFDKEVEKLVRSGLPQHEARRQARLTFGGMEQIKEECREARGISLLDTTVRDVRYGLRMLRKSPGFTATAVLTLALGIGANTAIFSMADWLIFQQLPVEDPKALTYLGFSLGGPNYKDNQFSVTEFQQLRQQCGDEFAGMAAVAFGGAGSEPDGFTYQGKTLPAQTFFVTSGFFPMLGLKPALGRFFTAEEGNTGGADPVVVLAWEYWQSRFHGDAAIVGNTVAINGHPVTIVGVAPKGFFGITPVVHMQAYLPLGMLTLDAGTPENFTVKPDARPLIVIARLKRNVRPEQVQPALTVVGKRLLAQGPRPDEKISGLRSYPLRPPGLTNSIGVDPLSKFAFLLLTLGALVLLLSCMNVANLLLVRATARHGEMAVRAALGAARGRLVRQLLTESVLLAGLGCLGGIAVGAAVTRALTSLRLPGEFSFSLDFQFNWMVFMYAFSIALVSGLIVGIVPALRVARANLTAALHDNGRTTTGRRQRLRNVMVASQVAGSLVLLIIAGLFMRSLQGVQRADLGFDPHNVMNMTLDANQIGYSKARGEEFYQRLLEQVRALPGVESASMAALVPMGDSEVGGKIDIPGYESVKGKAHPSALYNAVSPDYFETMGIPILRGRGFTEADGGKSLRVAVINEVMAGKYWQGLDPIGRQFSVPDDPKHPIQIVGIMKNSRTVDLYSPIEPTYFIPLAQHYFPTQTLQVRTYGALRGLAQDVQARVESLAPAMPVYGVRTMTQALNSLNGLFLFQAGAWLTGILGFLGLTLAVVGVYGVMAYSVSRRTHEIGIRMAMGAQRGQILAMVSKQGLIVVGAGLALGVLAAALISALVADFLVNTSPTDAITYGTVSLLLTAVAMAACYLPARRATQVDPMVALRSE